MAVFWNPDFDHIVGFYHFTLHIVDHEAGQFVILSLVIYMVVLYYDVVFISDDSIRLIGC